MKILITGAAGFIGAALARKLAEKGENVLGIDSINSYYDPRIKIQRLSLCGIQFPPHLPRVSCTPATGFCREQIEIPDIPRGEWFQSGNLPSYRFMRADICDEKEMNAVFESEKPDIVVNLAAQAGVRYSIENPMEYVRCNVTGFVTLLECARRFPVKHFVYASSSSVYGGNTKTPFSEEDRVDSPVSLYAATKKSDELFAAVYSGLYGIPCTGLRFFTVYGPYGRPDMAPALFAEAILSGRKIKVFNNGDMERDFTYIDDIVEGIIRVIGKPSDSPKVYNIGHGSPTRLMDFIATLEKALGKEAEKEFLPMQPGDVKVTFADTSALRRDFGYAPETSLEEGIRCFAASLPTP